MNKISTVRVTRGSLTFLEIEVDGIPLAHHFSGRHGSHPSQLPPLCWSSANVAHRAKVVANFLAEGPSELDSGRVPVLVCEECGDIGCGALAVRVVREGEHIRWTDWAYENGYETAQEITWSKRPGDFVFDRKTYESEIRKAL